MKDSADDMSATDDDVPPYMEEFYPHNAAIGTGHGREDDDPLYWTGHADIPTLPVLTGFMGTHGVYRHFTVMEQTAVMIGEAKHGMWRIQETGYAIAGERRSMVRETGGVVGRESAGERKEVRDEEKEKE